MFYYLMYFIVWHIVDDVSFICYVVDELMVMAVNSVIFLFIEILLFVWYIGICFVVHHLCSIDGM